jgi:catalase
MWRVVRWVAAALVGLVAIVAILYAVAARQPRVKVTTEEVPEPGEADAIMRLVRKATAAIEERAGNDRLYKRDAHAQPHGCVTGVLEVQDALAPAYRQGIFRDGGRRYKTWVRFSNGTQADDTAPDARGMAIKVMGVRGLKLLDRKDDPERKTQDFVMINYHTFFVRNLDEYEKFFDYQNENRPTAYFFAGPPWRWRLHELYHAGHMLFQRVPSPLATRYYSMSAYRFGTQNAKFSAQPCRPPETRMPRKRGPNYLRDALVTELQARDACFNFLVQLQDPTKNMPIEDPTIQWDEREVPYVPIATLRIPS